MIGLRGASRYAHHVYKPGFELEYAAFKQARKDIGLTNIIPMISFCRRIEKAERVIAKMSEFRLTRGENGLEVYMICKILLQRDPD